MEQARRVAWQNCTDVSDEISAYIINIECIAVAADSSETSTHFYQRHISDKQTDPTTDNPLVVIHCNITFHPSPLTL
jgi:hypothetical protein